MSIFRPNAVLVRTRALAGEGGRGTLYRSAIELEKSVRKVLPGQFFMIRPVTGSSAPLLPRALSALDFDARTGVLDVCYRVYGAGTAVLATLKPGDPLQVYGPYGNGFSQKELGRRPAVLVGGGVGVPPLYLWAKALREKGSEVIVLQGARTKEELLLLRDFRRFRVKLSVSTDDGSEGFKGRVGELFGEALPELVAMTPKPIVYSCGPHPMMKDVAKRALEAGLECRVSMEERMACGTKLCLGCVVPLERDGERVNVPSCTLGPVFDAAEVVW